MGRNMKRTISSLLLVASSFLFLAVYLNWENITGYFDKDIMTVQTLPMEELEPLLEGKEDAYMEPEILLDGGKIGYDAEQNMLLIPQNLSTGSFEGELEAADGTLYFLSDEGFGNKAEAISQRKIFQLFWVREEQTWMYNVFFTGMPVACMLPEAGIEEQEEIQGSIWLFDPYRSAARYQQTECSWHKRGATTKNYEKAGYKLSLKEKKSFLGMRKDDDWIFNALYDDEGLIHNRLSYLVWQEIAGSNSVANDEGISMEYVELFIGNEYRGVYGLLERIDKKQLSMSEKDILYKYRDQILPEQEDYYASGEEPEEAVVTIEYPKVFEEEDWEPLKQWVNLLVLGEMKDYEEGSSLLVMENAVDYNLFNQLIYGMDNIMKNVYFKAEYQGNGSYRMSKIPWDLNMTWGNSWVDDYNCGFNRYKEKNITATDGFSEDMAVLYQSYGKEVSALLWERWQELRREIITTEHITELLDRELWYLHASGAYDRNYQKWPPACDCWQEELIYEYIEGRILFLDSYYEQLYKDSR